MFWDQGYDHLDLDACIAQIRACIASHLSNGQRQAMTQTWMRTDDGPPRREPARARRAPDGARQARRLFSGCRSR
jgi:hypothetical protein